ncbi:MAG: hypothetical protein RMK20_06345 [Verrucomicrobiales bacterium]|nr:hypothetical protein [Verrucomicrobiales bacterium]
MIRRLVEAHFFQHRRKPTAAQVRFWFRELRTPQLLVELAHRFPEVCRRLTPQRPLLTCAAAGNLVELERALLAEELAERERDRAYWQPLRAELEALRRAKRR